MATKLRPKNAATTFTVFLFAVAVVDLCTAEVNSVEDVLPFEFGPPDDPCQQPKEVGPCKAYFEKVFFNSQTGQCEDFIYGGCGGNDNRFDTKEECEKTCGHYVGKREAVVKKSDKIDQDICKLEPDIGPCRAIYTKFYYDGESQSCQKFQYGGCLGNKNRFETEEECLKKCQLMPVKKDGELKDTGCTCTARNCGCCADLVVEKIGLNDTGCLNVTYDPDDLAISFLFSLDGKVLVNKTVSARDPPPVCVAIPYTEKYADLCLAVYDLHYSSDQLTVRNPPPVCFGVPFLHDYVSLCLQFYDMHYSVTKLSGCTKVQVKLYGVLSEEFPLGCFKLGPGKGHRAEDPHRKYMLQDNKTWE